MMSMPELDMVRAFFVGEGYGFLEQAVFYLIAVRAYPPIVEIGKGDHEIAEEQALEMNERKNAVRLTVAAFRQEIIGGVSETFFNDIFPAGEVIAGGNRRSSHV